MTAPATAVHAREAAGVRWPGASVLLPLTTAAAATEAVMLRGATRTLIHIPGIDRFEGPVRVVAEIARFSYYLAVVLVVGLLVTLLGRTARSGGTAVAAAIVVFLTAATAARLGLAGDLLVALAVLGAVAILVAPATRGAGGGRGALPVALLSIAFLAAGTHTIVQLAAGNGLSSAVPATALLVVAEVLAAAGALMSPRLVQRDRGVPVIAAAVVAVVTYGALAGGGHTVRILMRWNLGLGGWLPDPVYAAGAALLTYTVLAAWRSGSRALALALVLLACGGIGLHSTYQSGLVVAALAVLATRINGGGIDIDQQPPGPMTPPLATTTSQPSA